MPHPRPRRHPRAPHRPLQADSDALRQRCAALEEALAGASQAGVEVDALRQRCVSLESTLSWERHAAATQRGELEGRARALEVAVVQARRAAVQERAAAAEREHATAAEVQELRRCQAQMAGRLREAESALRELAAASGEMRERAAALEVRMCLVHLH